MQCVQSRWQEVVGGIGLMFAPVRSTGTGQTNLFKYIAGLNPLDPNSRFTLAIQPFAAQPGRRNLAESFEDFLCPTQRLFCTREKNAFHPVFVGRQFLAILSFADK